MEIVKVYLFLMFFSDIRQEVKIGKVIIHEQFEPETFDNDIALVCKFFCLHPQKKFKTSQIKLDQPVSLEVHTPACLPSTKFFKVILMMMMMKIRIMIIIIMMKILMTLLA